MSFDSLLINTCTIKRWSSTEEDGYNQPVKTYSDHLVDEPCRLVFTSTREFQNGNEVYISTCKLFLGNVDVIPQDTVEVLGNEYLIRQVLNIQDSESSHHKECVLEAMI